MPSGFFSRGLPLQPAQWRQSGFLFRLEVEERYFEGQRILPAMHWRMNELWFLVPIFHPTLGPLSARKSNGCVGCTASLNRFFLTRSDQASSRLPKKSSPSPRSARNQRAVLGRNVSRVRGDGSTLQRRQRETGRSAGDDDLPKRPSLLCADRELATVRVGRPQ
jgi:hypothetical protein